MVVDALLSPIRGRVMEVNHLVHLHKPPMVAEAHVPRCQIPVRTAEVNLLRLQMVGVRRLQTLVLEMELLDPRPRTPTEVNDHLHPTHVPELLRHKGPIVAVVLLSPIHGRVMEVNHLVHLHRHLMVAEAHVPRYQIPVRTVEVNLLRLQTVGVRRLQILVLETEPLGHPPRIPTEVNDHLLLIHVPELRRLKRLTVVDALPPQIHGQETEVSPGLIPRPRTVADALPRRIHDQVTEIRLGLILRPRMVAVHAQHQILVRAVEENRLSLRLRTVVDALQPQTHDQAMEIRPGLILRPQMAVQVHVPRCQILDRAAEENRLSLRLQIVVDALQLQIHDQEMAESPMEVSLVPFPLVRVMETPPTYVSHFAFLPCFLTIFL